jgi:hypothetical protein
MCSSLELVFEVSPQGVELGVEVLELLLDFALEVGYDLIAVSLELVGFAFDFFACDVRAPFVEVGAGLVWVDRV